MKTLKNTIPTILLTNIMKLNLRFFIVLSCCFLLVDEAWGQACFEENIENIISTNPDGAQDVYSIDLDGDGDNDVLSASFNDNKIAWYENDGQGNFSSENIISTNANVAFGVYSIDLDGDDDNDVLSASAFDDKIAWYENDGQGNFSTENIIDVLSASRDDKIAWYENNGQGNFSTENIISTNAYGANSVYSIDLDGDGDNDVLDDKIAWYANDGQGNFSSENIISTNANGAEVVHAIDIDGDGDNDVLSASYFDDKIVWYENICGVSVIFGCTNPNACNFDAAATTDDGSCILPLISVNDQPIPNGTYQASDEVNSIGTVPVGGNVNFKAGQTIKLDNNFTIESNADFSAEIEDCTGQ